jgi:transcriptional regulator with XRE-family HTH domain
MYSDAEGGRMPSIEAISNGIDWGRWLRRLGEQVLGAREFLGLSQDRLARLAGVSQGAVSRLENGGGFATPLLVVTKISAALHVELSQVDPELLSPEARRLVQQGLSLLDTPSALSSTGPEHDQAVQELLDVYHRLSERRRAQLLAVVRAMAVLSAETCNDGDTSRST